jgi:hypothetical protein
MKVYDFEYTDEKILFILLGICLVVFVALLFCMPYLVPVLGKIPNGLLVIGVPVAIFWFNRKKIKKAGSAFLAEDSLSISLEKGSEEILFSDLKSYKIEHHNGTTLNLKYNTANKMKLTANSNFCNSAAFEAFCDDLEKVVSQYSKLSHTPIVRSPSIFEQKWFLVFLVTVTAIIVIIFLHATYVGKAPSTSIYTSVAIFIGLWVAYFKTKQKSKNRVLED